METTLEILDRLEGVLRQLFHRWPSRDRAAVEREVLGLLQMARGALPREVQQATKLLQDAEGALARAREEARRIVLDAQAHARSLGEAGPGASASRAQTLADDARKEAERIRRGADDYALQVLQRLETEVDKVLATIRRGQETLRGSSAHNRRSE